MRGKHDPAHVLMPGVHRVASLLKRWLLGTHQGSVGPEHLDAYLNEFTFRFNRRGSRRRGLLFYRLLEQAILADPITYRSLIANPHPGRPRPRCRRDPRHRRPCSDRGATQPDSNRYPPFSHSSGRSEYRMTVKAIRSGPGAVDQLAEGPPLPRGVVEVVGAEPCAEAGTCSSRAGAAPNSTPRCGP